jgi:hypothetical protein
MLNRTGNWAGADFDTLLIYSFFFEFRSLDVVDVADVTALTNSEAYGNKEIHIFLKTKLPSKTINFRHTEKYCRAPS